MVVVRGRLEPEVGALLMQALAAAREALYQRARVPEGEAGRGNVSAETPTMAQRQADALALLAETALHQGLDPGAPGERYQVVVHVDAQALADPEQPGQSVLEDGARVSPETSQRLACDASRVVMRHDEEGRVVEIGARTRTIPPALRRALHHRDRGCRFPGCGVRDGQGHHSVTGRTAGRRRSRTSRCYAAGITAPSTRRATRSRAGPTGRSDSGGPTAARCLRCRRLLPCPLIPSRRSGRVTTRTACASRAHGVPRLARGSG